MSTAGNPTTTTPVRVIAYVDGFNLYFGMRAGALHRFYWLNVHLLAANLLRPDQQLIATAYFTSRISVPSASDTSPSAIALRAKGKRQSNYLEALATVPNLATILGHYLDKRGHCRNCGATWPSYEEKMTDVNIATELLTDAFQDRFDTAMLISADSDLTRPIQAVRRIFPNKRIIVAFPPNRNSITLRRVANGFIHIEPAHLSRSQFPDQVTKPNGFVLQRPNEWR